ncbi:MAG: hypothetical protein ACM3ZR_04900, partial [Pseudomonadota bacterium]
WGNTLYLIQEGIRKKRLKPVKSELLRQMILGTYINFLGKDFLTECNMSYKEATDEMIDIIISGIAL